MPDGHTTRSCGTGNKTGDLTGTQVHWYSPLLTAHAEGTPARPDSCGSRPAAGGSAGGPVSSDNLRHRAREVEQG